MSQLSQCGFRGPGQISTELLATIHAEQERTWRSRVKAFQETALIYGIQLLFRASLMLRRWNY